MVVYNTNNKNNDEESLRRMMLIEHNRSMENGKVPIPQTKEYYDEHLLQLIWNQSPYNSQYRNHITGSNNSNSISNYSDGDISDISFSELTTRRRTTTTVPTDASTTTEKSPAFISTSSTTSIRDEIVQHAMCYQPFEGYCGLATINTMLRSIGPYYVPYPNRGRGYSIVSLAEYLIVKCGNLLPASHPHPQQSQKSALRDVDVIFMNHDTTLDEFREIVKLSNDPNTRLLANFHRTPLFHSQRYHDSTYHDSTNYPWRRVFAGHWSPVAGYVNLRKDTTTTTAAAVDPTANSTTSPKTREGGGSVSSHSKGDGGDEEYVLVLDTNEKYGPYIVSLERFFDAVKTQTLHDGYRGFIKVSLNSVS